MNAPSKKTLELLQQRLIAAQEETRAKVAAISMPEDNTAQVPAEGIPMMQYGGKIRIHEGFSVGNPYDPSSINPITRFQNKYGQSSPEIEYITPNNTSENPYANFIDQFVPAPEVDNSNLLSPEIASPKRRIIAGIDPTNPKIGQAKSEIVDTPTQFMQEIPLNPIDYYGRLAAPVYNIIQGALPADQHNVDSFMNRKSVRVPKVNVDPQIEALTRDYTNAMDSVGITGQPGDAMTFANALMATKGANMGALYVSKENQEGQYAMSADQANAAIDAQNKAMRFQVEDANLQHKEMKQNMTAAGVGQLSEFAMANLDDDVNMGYINGISDIYDYSFPVKFKKGGFLTYKPRFLNA